MSSKDRLTNSGPLTIVYFAPLQGPNGSSATVPEEFPNFQNQFLSGDFSGFWIICISTKINWEGNWREGNWFVSILKGGNTCIQCNTILMWYLCNKSTFEMVVQILYSSLMSKDGIDLWANPWSSGSNDLQLPIKGCCLAQALSTKQWHPFAWPSPFARPLQQHLPPSTRDLVRGWLRKLFFIEETPLESQRQCQRDHRAGQCCSSGNFCQLLPLLLFKKMFNTELNIFGLELNYKIQLKQSPNPRGVRTLGKPCAQTDRSWESSHGKSSTKI